MEVQWKIKEQLGEYVMERLNHDPRKMSDKERNRTSERIRTKLKAGKKLSPEEIRFLQQTDPAVYMEYLRIRQMADSLKAQLKSARTKQEVNRIIATALSNNYVCRPYYWDNTFNMSMTKNDEDYSVYDERKESDGGRIVQGNQLTVYGVINGIEQRETLATGQKMEFPSITIYYIDRNN
ncbi:MAG: hypothetical protein K6A23_10620 [Butyrivibrio sp.]|nr:hypothetical protein [Butyrivibrio sp.]